MRLMFALLDFSVCKEIHTAKYHKHHIKGTNEFFFAKSSKFGEVQMEHLHTCSLYLKFMPSTSLSHILHNICLHFPLTIEKFDPKLFRLFDLEFSSLVCYLFYMLFFVLFCK